MSEQIETRASASARKACAEEIEKGLPTMSRLILIATLAALTAACTAQTVAAPDRGQVCRVQNDAGTVDLGPCAGGTDSQQSWYCPETTGMCVPGDVCQSSDVDVRGVVVACK